MCYLAPYRNFTLEMSLFPLCNSSWTEGRSNWAPDPELPPHKAVMLAQQCSEIIYSLLGPFPWTIYKTGKKSNTGIYLPSCLSLPFLSPPPSQCLQLSGWQMPSSLGRRSGTRSTQHCNWLFGSWECWGTNTDFSLSTAACLSRLARSPPMCIISLQDLSATSVF